MRQRSTCRVRSQRLVCESGTQSRTHLPSMPEQVRSFFDRSAWFQGDLGETSSRISRRFRVREADFHNLTSPCLRTPLKLQDLRKLENLGLRYGACLSSSLASVFSVLKVFFERETVMRSPGRAMRIRLQERGYHETLFCRCSGDPGDDYGGDDFGNGSSPGRSLRSTSSRSERQRRGISISRELLSRMEFGIPVSNVQVRNSVLPQLRISRLFSSLPVSIWGSVRLSIRSVRGILLLLLIFAVERDLRE